MFRSRRRKLEAVTALGLTLGLLTMWRQPVPDPTVVRWEPNVRVDGEGPVEVAPDVTPPLRRLVFTVHQEDDSGASAANGMDPYFGGSSIDAQPSGRTGRSTWAR